MTTTVRLVFLILGLFSVASCDPSREPEAQSEPAQPLPEPEDTVALTIYLRTGSDDRAMLKPVVRDVAVEGSLNLRAVELLLEGPRSDEDLEDPWPAGTQVHDVTVAGGTATVDLSAEALSGMPDPEADANLEALAFAALANTLTEFPTIDRVVLTVDGESAETSEAVKAGWGGWGLPVVLSRDESVVGEQGSGRFPRLADFSRASQSVGSADADPVHVRGVRVRDRITYVRLVVELADATDHDVSAPAFPRAYARSMPDELVLEVTGVETWDSEGVRAQLDDQLEPYVQELQVREGQRANSVRVSLKPMSTALRDVHLHTSGSPTRILLDVKK